MAILLWRKAAEIKKQSIFPCLEWVWNLFSHPNMTDISSEVGGFFKPDFSETFPTFFCSQSPAPQVQPKARLSSQQNLKSVNKLTSNI